MTWVENANSAKLSSVKNERLAPLVLKTDTFSDWSHPGGFTKAKEAGWRAIAIPLSIWLISSRRELRCAQFVGETKA